MANIQKHLKTIKEAVYGIEVRDGIHDAIQQCYNDAARQGNSIMEVVQARGDHETLEQRLEASEAQIKQIADQQIPAEYLQSSVDQYISENNSGLATMVDIDFLNNNITSACQSGEYKEMINGTFERGTIDGVGNSSEDPNYDYIARLKLKTLFGDNTTIAVEDGYRYKLHKYNKNTNAWISSAAWSTSATVINSDYKYRIAVSSTEPVVGYSLTEKEVYEYSRKVFILKKLPKEDLPISFNVAVWNIAHFGTGSSSEPGGTIENLVKYRNVIAELDADILLTCEDDPNFDAQGTSSLDAIYPVYKYKKQGSKRGYTCNSIYSDMRLSENEEINFNNRYLDTYFNHSTITLNNKTINIISTHLDWYDISIRQSQINQLIEYCKDMEYVLIGADFNTSCRVNGEYPTGSEIGNYNEDYQIFTNAGYYCANNGYFGMFGTVDIGLPWDNIIFKNMILKSVKTVDDNLSDHKPIVAKFVI